MSGPADTSFKSRHGTMAKNSLYNPDAIEVARAHSTVTIHTVPRRRLGGGPLNSTVPCPLCRALVNLDESLRGPEGRCAGCTVIVRLDSRGRPKAAGWMGGGDMKLAGAALRGRRSKLERRPTVKRRRTRPTGNPDHGTRAGYNAHRRDGEDPCDECREAYNAGQRANRQAARERRQAGTAMEVAA